MINLQLIKKARTWLEHMADHKLLKKLKMYGELADGTDFQIVTIHPLSDETKSLVKLGMKSEDVKLCDLYWAFKGKMFFVSIYFNKGEDAKVSYYLKPYTKDGYSFNVVTHHTPIDTEFVNKILNYLSLWIVSDNNPARLESEQRVIILSGEIFNALQGSGLR